MNPSMLGAGATSGLAIRPCAVGAHSSRAGGFGSRVWILDSRRLGDGGSRRLRNRGSLAWSRGGCDYNCGGGRCRRRRRQTRIWTVRGRSVSAGAQQQKGWYQGQKRLLNHVAHRLNRVRASGTLVDNSASCRSPQATYILFRRMGFRSCPPSPRLTGASCVPRLESRVVSRSWSRCPRRFEAEQREFEKRESIISKA
jgi:hypothetical protein